MSEQLAEQTFEQAPRHRRGRKPKGPPVAFESGFVDSRTRRPRLTSPEAWRRELRFIYRQTLEGRIPTQEATRLVYIVNVGTGLEQQAQNAEAIRRIEARIAMLEGTTPAFEMPLLAHEDCAGAVIDAEAVPSDAVIESA